MSPRLLFSLELSFFVCVCPVFCTYIESVLLPILLLFFLSLMPCLKGKKFPQLHKVRIYQESPTRVCRP